jgi:hypothetical protein
MMLATSSLPPRFPSGLLASSRFLARPQLLTRLLTPCQREGHPTDRLATDEAPMVTHEMRRLL